MKLHQEWDPLIILLSIAVAFVGAYGGITLYEQFRLCSKENKLKLLNPELLLKLMAVSLGGVAIWTMHFVGMGALRLKLPTGQYLKVGYRLDMTIGSLAVVILFSYIGLKISSMDKVFTRDKSDAIEKFVKDARNMTIQEIRRIQHKHVLYLNTLFARMGPLIAGGGMLAIGVCVMHYVGMDAIVADAVIEWNVGIIAASVIIALVAATAGFWILFRLLALFPYVELLRVASAAIISIAVNGMHYTGMAAATFVYKEGRVASTNANWVDQNTAILGALAGSTLFMWLIIIMCIADLRVWYYNLARIVREADIRASVHKASENSIISKQPFLLEYEELRAVDGSAASIMQFQLRIKQRTSTENKTSSNNMGEESKSAPVSSMLPTSNRVLPGTADDLTEMMELQSHLMEA